MPPAPSNIGGWARFGPFELNINTGELRKRGLRIKLQPQPFLVLRVLLSRPGELVSREELRAQLWSKDTHVEFEDGLNVAIRRLREALSDDAQNPTYIETVPRYGYRYISSIDFPAEISTAASTLVVPSEGQEANAAKQDRKNFPSMAGDNKTVSAAKEHRYFRRVAVFAIGMVIVAVLAASPRFVFPFSPRVMKYEQLSHDRFEKPAHLFTDGPHVYFEEVVSGKPAVAEVPTEGGEVVRIPVPFRDIILLDVLTDGSGMFVAANSNTPQPSFWKLPLPPGSPKPIGSLLSIHATWSPDGQHVAYTDNEKRTLHISNEDRTGPQRIFSIRAGSIECPRWSPDGRVLRFAFVTESQVSSLWEIERDGSRPHVVLSEWSSRADLCGNWTPNGKYYVFDSFREGRWDIWAICEKGGWRPCTRRHPVRMTHGPIDFFSPVSSSDGNRIFVLGRQRDGELVRYDSNSQAFVPYLGGISAGQLDFSQDGKWVTYVKHPEGTLWRRMIDGGNELQLTFAPLQADSPHWSPDGQHIAFRASLAGQPRKIFLIAHSGGTPQELMPSDRAEEGVPTWSPDGNSLVFGELRWHPAKIAVHIINLKSNQVSTVPGSQGLWTPRWSPDGRYLLALRADASASNSKSLFIFDFRTAQWRKLVEHLINEPVWSHDGKYIYFDVAESPKNSAVFRIAVINGRLEHVVSLENFQRAGDTLGDWFGLTPDDSPLLLRDRRNTEVYALDVEW